MLNIGLNNIWLNSAVDVYSVAGFRPELVLDMVQEKYRANNSSTTFSNAVTHARTSNATMVDSDGVLKWAPHNLLTYSEQFDNAAWTASNSGAATVTKSTANAAAAPDGTLTADRVIFSLNGGTTTSDIALLRQAAGVAGQEARFAVWLRSFDGTSSYVMQIILADGTAENITVTGSWQLFEGTPAVHPGATNYGIRLRGGQSPANADSADVLMWGGHAYRTDLGGMVANPDRGDSYVPTTSAAVYMPKRNHYIYNGTSWVKAGALFEPTAATNLVTYSSDFTNAAWTASASSIGTLAVNATGPDGQTSAVTLVDSNAGGAGSVWVAQTVTVATSTRHTYSVYAKAGGESWLSVNLVGFTTPGNSDIYFDLSSGVVGSVVASGGSVTSDIENVGNGWYRCSVSFTTDASDTSAVIRNRIATADLAQTAVPLDGTSSILIYGAQLEAGSVPSSYIPTAGSTATRAAETVTIAAAKVPYPTPEVIGAELVTNGTFDTDTTGWSVYAGALSVSAGEVTVTNNGADYGQIYRTISTVVGKVYQLSATVRRGTAASVNLRAETALTAGNLLQLTSTSATNVTLSGYFVATGTSTIIGCANANTNNGTGIFDNISIQEINPLSLWIQMEGYMTYADNNADAQIIQLLWAVDGNNRIRSAVSTNAGSGRQDFQQVNGGTFDNALSDGDYYSPGINVPFNIASRHGSTFINGATDGTALTANTTPVALPALSSTNLALAHTGGPIIISKFRMGTGDPGDAGIEEAST